MVGDGPRSAQLVHRRPAVNRGRIGFGILLGLSFGLALASLPAAAPAQGVSPVAASLRARNLAFLTAVDSVGPEGILEFFPGKGDFTYVHTAHQISGDHRRVWRFPAEQTGDAIAKGPLWESFASQVENQTVGLFAHQITMRGVKWHRVSGTRFVPPGETASSPIFVEWRREGSKWVVSSFGDESFSRLPLPPWMN